jgi:hypothetical protein
LSIPSVEIAGPATTFLDLVDGKFSQTTPAELAAFFASLRETNKLVVHFHGGLVGREAAHDTARILAPVFEAGGAASLFVVWNTDLETTLTHNLGKIALETIFWTLVQRIRELLKWKVATSAMDAAGVRAGRRVPLKLALDVSPARVRREAEADDTTSPSAIPQLTYAEETEVRKQLGRDRLLQRRVLEIAPSTKGARGARALGKATLMSPNIVRKLGPTGPGKARVGAMTGFIVGVLLRVLRAVIARRLKGTDHRLYTTIVEEVLRGFYLANLGRAVWSSMKDLTVEAFTPNNQVFGGTALLDHLAAWRRDGRQLTLTGHSAGSVFILELLDHAAKRGVKLNADVVLMAPACTSERFREAIPAIGTTVRGIRLFSMCDQREHGYSEVKYIYDASLLYLISGVLEARSDTPILGMQRYYSGVRPYRDKKLIEVDQFFDGRLVWAPSFNAPQRQCNGTRHGGFDEETKMKESLTDIVARGLV